MKKSQARQIQQLPLIQGVLYDQRFLESHAGSQILHDPKTAVVELIANAWDAGATEVYICWPKEEGNRSFSIDDNGIGMTDEEFQRRWRMLSYNRPFEQGSVVKFPDDLAAGRPERIAFGRNGIGRWSGFCFGLEYFVDTRKNGRRNRYRVTKGTTDPFAIDMVATNEPVDRHGTCVECPVCKSVTLSPEDARSEIGMRFLTDPNFQVFVNNEPVDFSDIDDPNIKRQTLPVGNGNSVELIIIDTQVTDRTTKQHGIAWHVGGRLVGSCTWKGVATE